jgi:hypothetical protein
MSASLAEQLHTGGASRMVFRELLLFSNVGSVAYFSIVSAAEIFTGMRDGLKAG